MLLLSFEIWSTFAFTMAKACKKKIPIAHLAGSTYIILSGGHYKIKAVVNSATKAEFYTRVH